jgi:hypothetical protein
MLTRKDFELIAGVLKQSEAPEDTITLFADILRYENRNFNREKFIAAATPKTDAEPREYETYPDSPDVRIYALDDVFEAAINRQILSRKEAEYNYYEPFMYVCTRLKSDLNTQKEYLVHEFKHQDTRQYLRVREEITNAS